MLKSTSLRRMLFCGTAGVALACGGVAQAQTDPAAPADAPTGAATVQQTAEPEPASVDGEVTVTGSRVARSGFQAPTPLTVLSQRDIQNTSPSNNIADFVNQLPSMAGSTRPSNSRLNLSSGQAGINALNLRNLGEVRTLVLLDGRRSVGSTITGLVDVNTIPQALIKSVEVVTGGASAAYGSDAVAGVVNFILDKKYTGLKVQADSGVTTYGDGANYSFNVTGGHAFAGGRGHILVSGEIAHRDGIFTVDRKWNATGYMIYQNPAWTATSTVPRYLVGTRFGAANSTPGGLITASTGTTANSLRGIYFGQGGQARPFQYGTITSTTPGGTAITQGGDWLVNDSGRRIGLDPRDSRQGVFGRLSWDFSDSFSVFAEASYNRQSVYFNAGPNLSTGVVLNATGCGTAATPAAAPITCNAFLYNTLGPAALTGVTSVTVATTFADLPFRAVDNRRRVQRYTLGAEGDLGLFGKAAPWNIYGQYGVAKLREQLRNIQNIGAPISRLTQATNVAFAQAGNPRGYAVGSIQCTINLDAVTTNDDANCVPLNRLGVGVANPAAIPYVLGDPYRDEKLEQWVTGVNLSVTPFATWAGDVSVAFGGEYRKEKISGFVPTQFQPLVAPNPAGGILTTNQYSVGNYLPTNGQYNVKEAYLEAVVPLGLGLEFNGAARATDYSISGNVTTWKLGVTWRIGDDVRFRVTRSRDIRAPNLFEFFSAGSSNSDSVNNPFFRPASAGGSTALNGVIYPNSSISYSATATGNLALQPEKSNQWNIGAVLTPSAIPGLALSADYFRIDIDQAIGTLSAQEVINRCFEGRAEYCAAIAQDPNNAARILFRTQPFNFANQLVRGMDFDASYRMPMDKLIGGAKGSLFLRALATRYFENRVDQGIVGALVLNTVGVNSSQFATPKWIYRFNTGYETERFSLTATARGISDGKYSASAIECTADCPLSSVARPTYSVNHVKGLFYVDLNLSQKVRITDSATTQFFFNVTNVFNKGPLLLPETGLAANSTYSDLLGRQFRVGIRAELK